MDRQRHATTPYVLAQRRAVKTTSVVEKGTDFYTRCVKDETEFAALPFDFGPRHKKLIYTDIYYKVVSFSPDDWEVGNP